VLKIGLVCIVSVIVIALGVWLYVVPHVVPLSRRWELTMNTKSLLKNELDYEGKYENEVGKIRNALRELYYNDQLYENDLQKIESCVNALNDLETKSNLLNDQGRNLLEIGKNYPNLKFNMKITDSMQRLETIINKLKGTQNEVFMKKQEFQELYYTKSLIDSAEEFMFDLKRFLDRPVPSLLTDKQQYLDDIRNYIMKINDLKENFRQINIPLLREIGNRYKNIRYVSKIEYLNNQVDMGKSQLESLEYKLAKIIVQRPPKNNMLSSDNSPMGEMEKLKNIINGQLDDPIFEELRKEFRMYSSFDKLISQLKEIESPKQFWWLNIALLRKRDISDKIAFLKQIDPLVSKSNDKLQQLNQYKSQVEWNMSIIKSKKQMDSLKEKLENRLSEIKKLEIDIKKFADLARQFNINDLLTILRGQARDAQAETSKQITLIVLVFISGVIWLIFAIIKKHFGKKAGQRKLDNLIQSNAVDRFNNILRFIETNKYPLCINEEAIAYIRQIAFDNPTSNTLKQISNVAEARLKKIGELNERIGWLLQEVAAGIENILNR
jgi:hypothetical protein